MEMENSRMVIDTSVFIEHLRAKDKSKSILSLLPDNTEIIISTIVLFELFTGARNDIKKREIEELVEMSTIVDFNNNTARIAGEIFIKLQSSHQAIEFRDILIAASAKEHNLPIKTLNKKDFSRIDGIVVI